jgi:hypothetical protein
VPIASGVPSPQGHLAGFATAELNHHGFKKSFVEHGHIHGYMIIRADLTYQQGVNIGYNTQNEEKQNT